MAQGLRSRTGVLVRPVMRWWDRVPMRVQGRVTVALPLVAAAVSAVLAVSGNSERVSIENDIQRRFEMSAALGGISSLMINAETGMRGYLLTGQGAFLEPFDQASRELPSATQRLDELAAQEPGEGPRAEVAARLHAVEVVAGSQMADLSFQRGFVASGRSPDDPEIRAHLTYGKGLMDRIRGEVGGLQARERELLDERLSDIDAIRLRDYIAVALALIVAVATRFVAWFLFRNGTMRRVERLTAHLRDRRDGHPSPLPPPTKSDHLGELEREVALVDDAAGPAPPAHVATLEGVPTTTGGSDEPPRAPP